MKIIFGIGNPGNQYEKTRHNAGWMVVDRVATRCGVTVSRKMFHARVTIAALEDEKLLLVKPQTYVNRVGGSARALMDYYKCEPEEMLVVVDDVNLPVGQLRVRAGGAAGGHNGLKSLIGTVGAEFHRLRFGLGAPADEADLADYVPSPFKADEKECVGGALEQAVEAVGAWATRGVEACMNEFN